MYSLLNGSDEILSDNRQHVRNEKLYKLVGHDTHTHTPNTRFIQATKSIASANPDKLRASYNVRASFVAFYGLHFVMRFIESQSAEEVS